MRRNKLGGYSLICDLGTPLKHNFTSKIMSLRVLKTPYYKSTLINQKVHIKTREIFGKKERERTTNF